MCPAANYYNYYDYRPEAADKFTNTVQTKKKQYVIYFVLGMWVFMCVEGFN